MSKWQPIETAPHVGTVLAWGPDWDVPAYIVWYADHPRAHQPGWEWFGELDGFFDLQNESKPTHWLPDASKWPGL